MKTSTVAAILFALLSSLGFGQAPVPTPRRHSLSLEAQSVSNGGTTKVKSGGSAKTEQVKAAFGGDPIQTEVSHVHEERDTSSRTNVQVDIRNLGPVPDGVKLEWYFVAESVGGHPGTAHEFVFDRGSQDVSLGANATDSRIITSKEAQNVQKRSATVLGGADGSGVSFVGGGNARGKTTQSGILIRGWFVRLTDGGQVVAARGSSQAYEDVANDDAKLQTLLAQRGGKAKR